MAADESSHLRRAQRDRSYDGLGPSEAENYPEGPGAHVEHLRPLRRQPNAVKEVELSSP
jgi:hypothetical protein